MARERKEEYMDALRRGDCRKIRHLLLLEDPDSTDDYGRKGDRCLLAEQLLLEAGDRVGHGKSALHVAAERGASKLMEEMIGLFGDGKSESAGERSSSSKSDDGERTSSRSAARDCSSVLTLDKLEELLLARAFDGYSNLNPLAVAVLTGNPYVIRSLIKASFKCKTQPYRAYLRYDSNVVINSYEEFQTHVSSENMYEEWMKSHEEDRRRVDMETEDWPWRDYISPSGGEDHDDNCRNQLRSLMQEVLTQFQEEQQKRIIKGFNEDVRFNFLPWDEYLLHHLCGYERPTVEETFFNMRFVSKFFAILAKKPNTTGLLRYIFRPSDGQGKSPLHSISELRTVTLILALVLSENPELIYEFFRLESRESNERWHMLVKHLRFKPLTASELCSVGIMNWRDYAGRNFYDFYSIHNYSQSDFDISNVEDCRHEPRHNRIEQQDREIFPYKLMSYVVNENVLSRDHGYLESSDHFENLGKKERFRLLGSPAHLAVLNGSIEALKSWLSVPSKIDQGSEKLIYVKGTDEIPQIYSDGPESFASHRRELQQLKDSVMDYVGLLRSADMGCKGLPPSARKVHFRTINFGDSDGELGMLCTPLQLAAVCLPSQLPREVARKLQPHQESDSKSDLSAYWDYAWKWLKGKYQTLLQFQVACAAMFLYEEFSVSKDGPLKKHVPFSEYPLVHCAALSGRHTSLRVFMDIFEHDIMCLDAQGNSLLHHVVAASKLEIKLHMMDLVFCKKLDNFRLPPPHSSAAGDGRGYPTLEESFWERDINFLLQAGVDIWHKNTAEDVAAPGALASAGAQSWWYTKVAQETLELKSGLNQAANAISVTAALVATASYVGPLQPPLGYGSDDHLQVAAVSVRVFIVCNTLAFYLGLAAIMLSLLPALPVYLESTLEEMKRTRRTVTIAVGLLMTAIVLILVAFAAASIAVTPSHGFWNQQRLTTTTAILGGFVCAFTLYLCVLRLLRLAFYRNSKFRMFYKRFALF